MLNTIATADKARDAARLSVWKSGTKAGLKKLEQQARAKALPAAKKFLNSKVAKDIRDALKEEIRDGGTEAEVLVQVDVGLDERQVSMGGKTLYVDPRILKVVIASELAAAQLRKKGYKVSILEQRGIDDEPKAFEFSITESHGCGFRLILLISW